MQLQFTLLKNSHVNELLNIWADNDVIQYTNMKLPCTLDDAMNRVEAFKSFDIFSVSQNDTVIGIVGCPPMNKEQGEYGLFYQFCKSAWGQGNATKATKWMIEFMKEKYGEVSLFADVIVDNVASEKILQKFGFQFISEEIIKRYDIDFKVHNYKLQIKNAN